MTTYTIKPLKWVKISKKADNKIGWEYWGAKTPFNYGHYGTNIYTYRVENKTDITYRVENKYGCAWDYYFDEENHKELITCKSIEDGKKKAQIHWEKKIRTLLGKVLDSSYMP